GSRGIIRTCSYTGRRSERRRSPDGSGVNREVHAPFCERPEVKLLRPTHPRLSDQSQPRSSGTFFSAVMRLAEGRTKGRLNETAAPLRSRTPILSTSNKSLDEL